MLRKKTCSRARRILEAPSLSSGVTFLDLEYAKHTNMVVVAEMILANEEAESISLDVEW